MNELHVRALIFQIVVWAAVVVVAMPAAVADDGQMGGEADMIEADDEDSEAYEKMLELSAAGNELYEEGRIEEAADTYSAAYEKHPQPILLKNEMVARYLTEECERAIELGEAFVETGEGSEQDIEETEAVFGECSLDLAEEAVAEEKWMVAQDWLDYGEPHWSEPQLRDDGEELRGQVEAGIEDGGHEVDEIDEPAIEPRQIAGWSAIGVGAAALVGAGVWHISWERENRALDDLRGDPDADSGEIENRQSELDERYGTVRWAIPTMYGVGAVATAAGIGLLLWSPDGADGAASLQPIWTAETAGAMLRVSF